MLNSCNCSQSLLDGFLGNTTENDIVNITAGSEPSDDWGCQEWMTWHKRLVEEYGPDLATDLFRSKWDDQGFFDWEISACRYDTDFVNYFLSYGLDLRSFVSAIFTNTTEAVVNVTETAKDTTNTANWLLPVALGGVVVIGGVILYSRLNAIVPKTQKTNGAH